MSHRNSWSTLAAMVAASLLAAGWHCGTRPPGAPCSADDECFLGLPCVGRRATCDVRLVLQNAKAERVDVTAFGMSNRAWSMGGFAVRAGCAETIDSFVNVPRRELERTLRAYLRVHPGIVSGDLVILDMEPGDTPECPVHNGGSLFHLPLLWQDEFAPHRDALLHAFRLRVSVAREVLPHVRLGLFQVVVPHAWGVDDPRRDDDLIDRRMAVYERGGELGLYDELDYLVPVAYARFGPSDTVNPPWDERIARATRQAVEKSMLLRRSDGTTLVPLAPLLTFWTANGNSAHNRKALPPETLSRQIGILQEYERVRVIGLWAPDEDSTTFEPIDFEGYLSQVEALGECDCACGEPCQKPPCGRVAVGPFPMPDPLDWTPDRRPVRLINLFGGHWNHNVTGNAPWWVDEAFAGPSYPGCDPQRYLDDGCLPLGGRGAHTRRLEFAGNGIPDPIDDLLRRLDGLYAEGWRRIVLNRPAGMYQGPDETLPAAQFWTMPRWKREGLRTHLGAWLEAHPDLSLGIYVGFRITTPCELSAVGQRVPDPSKRRDMCVVKRNLRPWMKIGIRHVWFDAASVKDLEPPNLAYSPLEALFQIAQSPDYRGRLRIGGEAIPFVQDVREQLPDGPAIARGPFMALWRFYENFPCLEGRPRCRPGERWTVPATTEVGVAFHLPVADVREPPRPLSFEIVQDYVRRGFVPWAWTDDPQINQWVREVCGGPSQPCLPQP